MVLAAWFAAGAATAENDDMVADHRHCHNVVRCRVAPMAFEACGNPAHHVVFDNSTGIRTAIESKAAGITLFEEEGWRGRMRPADCRPEPAPVPACHRNRCASGVDHDD